MSSTSKNISSNTYLSIKTDASTGTSTSVRKHPIIQNFLVVWLDPKIDESVNDFRNSLAKLRGIAKSINTFTNAVHCIEYLKKASNGGALLIIAGSIGQKIVPEIHALSQLKSIFVFCRKRAYHEQWAKDWSKISGVYTKITPLCQAMQEEVEKCAYTTTAMTFDMSNALHKKSSITDLPRSMTNISNKSKHQTPLVNSRLSASQNSEQLEWTLFDLDACMYIQNIQREIFSISKNALQIAMDAMRKADDLRNLTHVVWKLLEAAEQKNDITYFIHAYTHEGVFYKLLNRKLAQQDFKNFTGASLEEKAQQIVGGIFQNLKIAVNAAMALQAGQQVSFQGGDERNWAKLYLRSVYALLLVPNPTVRFQGTTYRGMWISQDKLQHYCDAQFVCYKAVASTSAVREIAQYFIDNTHDASKNMISAMFIHEVTSIGALYALKISEFSKFPHEKEVLLLPGILFRIADVRSISKNAAEIELRCSLEDTETMMSNAFASLLALDS
ncbi:unnamed protein product [Rotaria sp. Silwood2]|nr:unnamed protein product [Rotaria sp. Silwood2]